METKDIIQYIKMRLDILNGINWEDMDDNEKIVALNSSESLFIYIKKLFGGDIE